MANPTQVFILTDGPRARKTRYYQELSKATASLMMFHGWSRVRMAEPGIHYEFGAFSALLLDRAGVDLTPIVLPRVTFLRACANRYNVRPEWAHRAQVYPNEGDYEAYRATCRQVRTDLTMAIGEALALP